MLKIAGHPVEFSFVLSTAVESSPVHSFVLKAAGSSVESSGVLICTTM